MPAAPDARRMRAFKLALALLVACTASLAFADDAAQALAGAALRDALLRGGYVLYFRHASTDFGQNDEQMSGYEDCARQQRFRIVARIRPDGWDALRQLSPATSARP